jgi:rRNA maturation RNase YbeY
MTSDPDPAASRPTRSAPRPPRATPRLTVDVCDATGRPAAARAPGLGPWLARIAPPSARGTVTLALVGNARMRTLNREYRSKDYATDVLSFPTEPSVEATARNPRRDEKEGVFSEPDSVPLRAIAIGGAARQARPRTRSRGEKEPVFLEIDSLPSRTNRARAAVRHLGDIVIATGVAARQARRAGHSVGTELRVLALHGLLHLLGYDHEHDQGAMARIERRLRRRGGLREGLIERAV